MEKPKAKSVCFILRVKNLKPKAKAKYMTFKLWWAVFEAHFVKTAKKLLFFVTRIRNLSTRAFSELLLIFFKGF